MFNTPEVSLFASALSILNFGLVDSGIATLAERYLVVPGNEPIHVRSVAQYDGSVKYAIDQLSNPRTVTVQPGGLFKDQCVIAGSIGTGSDDPVSISLYRLFAREIKKRFVFIKPFWVGPEALHLLRAGARLTEDIRQPPEWDLRPP
jgi:hypothetical protein